jgi:hypothetical protein
MAGIQVVPSYAGNPAYKYYAVYASGSQVHKEGGGRGMGGGGGGRKGKGRGKGRGGVGGGVGE